MNRRQALSIGGLTALGLSLTDWCRSRTQAAQSRTKRAPAAACILIWLDGGPSHLDTFDLKPAAPSEVRGPFAPIATSAAGVDICEFMPQTAAVMEHVALVRSMTSTLGEHNFGSHYLLTGYKPTPVLLYPSYGAVVAHQVQGAGVLPPYVAIPDYNDQAGAGFLPSQCGPFAVGGDPAREFRVRDLDLFPGITADRLRRRRDYLSAFDDYQRTTESHSAPADPQFEQAYRLLTSSKAKQAFNLAAEPAEVRSRYGDRTLGQSCLLARRLVEAGVPFVTVTDRGWDTHDNLYPRLKEGFTGGTVGMVPTLDLAWSALVADLAQRGMLDQTLVVLMGEFGRTPKLNTAGGRDHWPRVFTVALAGGGVPGGQVYGRSDSRGEAPADRPVLPSDLAATIYTLLGVDPGMELHTPDGRPVRVSQGNVVPELAG